MSIYPKVPYVVGKDVSLLYCERKVCKKVAIRRNLPGNIIVVHGVNDLGVSYQAVEHGLCEGLKDRLGRGFTPASYRMPVAADKDKLEEDPDAVFFKRSFNADTNSPVIPFYWGYREVADKTGKKMASMSTAMATGWTRTCRKKAAPSAMPPAACPTCGAVASMHRSIRWATPCGPCALPLAACIWCWRRSGWRH